MSSESLSEGKGIHLLYGVLFTVIALAALIALIRMQSRADSVSQTLATGNATPAIDSVTISTASYGSAATSVTLTEATTTNVYVWGTASDSNGCEQIDAAADYSIKVYRTNVTGGSSCTADDNDCYSIASGSIVVDQCTAGGTDLISRYQGTLATNYFADPTDTGATQSATNWTASVTANDGTATSSAGTATTEVNTLLSLDVTGTVNYGTIALGGTSADQTVSITNTGNAGIDATILATTATFSCTVGSFAVGQAEWSTTAAFSYGAGTDMTTTAAALHGAAGAMVPQRTAGVSSTNFYTAVQLPSTGISGTCTNTLTVAATASN